MRRTLMIAAFAAIVIASIDPAVLSVPFFRASLAEPRERYADPVWLEYVQFLRDVRARTRGGERIALVVPVREWDKGYCYAYYRASYFLSGREVLPLVDSSDRLHLENLRRADVVAAWRAAAPPTHRTVVWRGDGGALVAR